MYGTFEKSQNKLLLYFSPTNGTRVIYDENIVVENN